MKYKIPVEWTVVANMEIEAGSLEEATQLAHQEPFPPGEYVNDSFEVRHDETAELNPGLTETDKAFLEKNL